jgi:hypothetical protein
MGVVFCSESFPDSFVHIIEQDLAEDLYGTDRKSHFQLAGDEVRDYDGIQGTQDAPGKRLGDTLELAVLLRTLLPVESFSKVLI